MKRRNFIKSSALAGTAIAGTATAMPRAEKQKYIEVVKYELPTSNDRNALEQFYNDHAIKALNKFGVGKVGLLKPKYGESNRILKVVLEHDDLDSAAAYRNEVFNRPAFVKTAADYMDRTIDTAMYARFSSNLYRAFEGMPTMDSPVSTDVGGRIFEFRIYESHNIPFAKKKIHMFNEGGELAIFRETGLDPVFFGEAVFGDRMPNLTYMLCFENEAKQAEAWDKFRNHPDWKKLSGDPFYKDTVTRITDIIYRPGKGSQI